MAVILWTMGLSLLIQGCLSSIGNTDRGCLKWVTDGNNVCCEECYPGNRLVKKCGPSPKDLCTPCEFGTFTVKPKHYMCTRCTQCEGAQILVKACTATSDSKCGCRGELTCGDELCSFCVKKCGKGEELTAQRSCRPCPNGTFNDQSNQKCKPWSTKCPNPDQVIVARADAFNDIKCNASVSAITIPKQPDEKWSMALSVIPSFFLMAFIIVIMIIIVAVKILKKKKEPKKKEGNKKPQIIRTPTDDPETLIAIECSFHEAQQEQGSSSESLASKDSSGPLIA